ncbi:hypothetical protein K8I85_00460, partial [bacterium]|nr:hypothetical protein [bacterium]
DGVFLGPGNRNVLIAGRQLTIRSQSGIAAACVLDAGHTGALMAITEGSNVNLENLAFTNGGDYARTLRIDTSEAAVSGCRFTGNATCESGIVFITQSYATVLSDCIFESNTSLGGGCEGSNVYIRNSTPQFVACYFYSASYYLSLVTAVASSPAFSSCHFEGGGEAPIGEFSESSPSFQFCTFLDCRGINCTHSYPAIDHSSFIRAGSLHFEDHSHARVESSTLVGSALVAMASNLIIDKCIITRATDYVPVHYFTEDGSNVTVGCTNITGNPAGDWVGPVANWFDPYWGNISADPQFCDPDNDDYSLMASSPCLPANNSCGQMGAFGQGCGPVSLSQGLSERSWGGIKAAYR